MLVIGGLLMSFMVPNLSTLRSRTLHQEAQQLVSMIDLARQRAVVTGVPHRLTLDLEENGYGLDWEQSVETDSAEVEAGLLFDNLALDGGISLEPPARAQQDFFALPGKIGDFKWLEGDITIARVETPGGSVNHGEALVFFERDGTSSFTTIALDDEDGRRVILEILPLADTVRIIDETD